MMEPPGSESRKNPHAICRLKKSLYGPKQAPRAWHAKITQYLHQIGFQMSQSDNFLYTRNDPKCTLVILLYVEDLVIRGEDLVAIQKTKSLLSN